MNLLTERIEKLEECGFEFLYEFNYSTYLVIKNRETQWGYLLIIKDDEYSMYGEQDSSYIIHQHSEEEFFNALRAFK